MRRMHKSEGRQCYDTHDEETMLSLNDESDSTKIKFIDIKGDCNHEKYMKFPN